MRPDVGADGARDGRGRLPPSAAKPNPGAGTAGTPSWAEEAEKELKKIPFFVRGKARRNTERFAQERGVARITVETLYDAKATSAAETTPLRVVIVTLDSHLASAAARAQQALRADAGADAVACTPPPNGATTRPRWSAAGPTSHAATS